MKDNGKKCCAQGGAQEAFSYLKGKLKARGLHGAGQIRVSQSGCLGRCALGPCIVVYPEGLWYTYRANADLDEIIEQALCADQVIPRLKYCRRSVNSAYR